MLISMTNICSYLCSGLASNVGKRRPFEQGEQLYLAGHIVGFGVENNKIVGRCMTSTLAAQPHHVEIVLQDVNNYNKWLCTCSCKAGAGGKCKHIAATLICLYNAKDLQPLSCTDVAQMWGKRKKSLTGEIKDINDFCHVANDTSDHKLEDHVKQRFMMNCFKAAEDTEAAIHYSERDKGGERDIRKDKLEVISQLSQASRFNTFLYNLELFNPLRPCCVRTYNKLYPCDPLDICLKTIKDEKLWLKERQFRVTGTRCYGLYTYKGDNWQTKIENYFYPTFLGNSATEYGKKHEHAARDAYQKYISEWGEVVEYGLAVCPSNPWLACSPDGVVLVNGKPVRLLEIKCPIAGAKEPISKIYPNLPYIKKDLQLSTNHSHYAQVQLGMMILNLPTCDFVMYSTFDGSMEIKEIPINEEFCHDLLRKLKSIFFDKMLHHLCELTST